MTAAADPLLQVRSVTRRFGGLVAVDDLSFDLGTGEILGLIGPNGAGKSTTFNLVAGALAPNSGSILLDGEDLVGLRPHQVAARGIMRTFQHNMAFEGMTVSENILVGRHTRMRHGLFSILAGTSTARRAETAAVDRAAELIDFVGLSDWSDADVGTLSFGQGRLLETARALAGEPRIVLFDEPAAGLTPTECDRLAEIIQGIAARGISVLLIEHDMRFLMPLAERVVVLNFGAKIADGASAEIERDPAVVAAYLGDPSGRIGAEAGNA
jgi:branched-chain amino acid transport system ATP-binding protein